MRVLLALCLSLASCVAMDTEPQAEFFVVPSRSLTIPAEGWTMERLVLEYGRATETRFLFEEETLARLKQAQVPIGEELVLEPSAMHSVVELLLVEMGYLLSIPRAEKPRFVSVHFGRGAPSGTVPFVEVSDLDPWREHPAYLIRTVLILDASDSQFIANALGSTVTHSGPQQIVSLGQANGLLIQGTGPWVAELVDMLTDVNERERLLSTPIE